MSAVQMFDFRGEQLRCSMVDGEPQFVAADVARALGYASTQGMTKLLEDDEKGQSIWITPGGSQSMLTVNESGLYSAVFRSGLPMAKDFKRWVTKEVLPQIRQTGSYSVPTHPSAPGSTMVVERDEVMAIATRLFDQAQQLAIAAPKVEAFDELMDAEGLYTMEQAAKCLGYGRNVLFRELRKLSILQGKNNLPYQAHMHRFSVKVGTRSTHEGLTMPTYTTLVRPMGLEYLRRRLAQANAQLEAPSYTQPAEALPPAEGLAVPPDWLRRTA